MTDINEYVQTHTTGRFSDSEINQMICSIFLSSEEKSDLLAQIALLESKVKDYTVCSQDRRNALYEKDVLYNDFVSKTSDGDRIRKARFICRGKHSSVNHYYGQTEYLVHLDSVFAYGCVFIRFVPKELRVDFLIACYAHDLIEDARLSYSDVKRRFGSIVADMVYAVTHGKGKTRKEKASKEYYRGIKEVPYADLLKICDRLSNYDLSLRQNNITKLEMYVGEYESFEDALYDPARYNAWTLLSDYNRRAKDVLNLQRINQQYGN